MGEVTDAKIGQVVDVCLRHGHDSIIVLSGVAGTGKSHIASDAAVALSGHAAFVREVQFHPSYAYEDFVEGLRPMPDGGFKPEPGVLLEWSNQAHDDPDNVYVLLIEELSRAPLTTVLGEVMTYIEYRDRTFVLPISRQQVSLAQNLHIIATMNPRDRSALEVDDALLRRLRIVDCPPDIGQLKEMLEVSLGDDAPPDLLEGLIALFTETRGAHPDTYDVEMPFGHGIFAGVTSAGDLYDLWHQRIKHILRRPLVLPHPFAETISGLYPWQEQQAPPVAEGGHADW